MSIANRCRFIAKVLIGTAIVFGALIGASAPASADTNTAGTNPHAFSTLSCDCQKTAPAGGPASSGEIESGNPERLVCGFLALGSTRPGHVRRRVHNLDRKSPPIDRQDTGQHRYRFRRLDRGGSTGQRRQEHGRHRPEPV